MKILLTINGKKTDADVAPNTVLVDYIRTHLRLTGTHVGCDTSQCGACTVLLDGKPVKACAMLMGQVDGKAVTTIEGLVGSGELHPIQEAFRTHHGLQCGFCTPGMILAAKGIIDSHGVPDKDTIREELEGNLCRCTGYQNIVNAVAAAAKNVKGA